jgi:hypothetical protein
MRRAFAFTLSPLVAVAVAAGAFAACGDDDDGGNGATPEPTAMIATFRVADIETYRVRLTDPVDIETARKLLAGELDPLIPNGRVVRGETDVNEGWSWHIDPGDFEFAEVTVEVCDGLPSYVEDGTVTSDRFCPWSAVIVSLEPAE